MYIKEITDWLRDNNYSFDYIGNEFHEVTGFASLDSCKPGKITWVKKAELYNEKSDKTNVSVAVVQQGLHLTISNQIIAKNSKEVFFGILHHFWGKDRACGYIGEGSFISPEAIIDPTAYIGFNCSIDGTVQIGAGTIIENNVSIMNKVLIGKNVLIHSNATIGSDGFGFAFGDDGKPIKVEHFGGVIVGDRVEIGANTCIDRGTLDNTVIEDDVKIDNLVHIAHNVVLASGATVVAGAIVCGSAKLGSNCYVAPGGIIRNQLDIGDNAFVGLGAVVTRNVESSNVVAGVPAKVIRTVKKGDK